MLTPLPLYLYCIVPIYEAVLGRVGVCDGELLSEGGGW